MENVSDRKRRKWPFAVIAIIVAAAVTATFFYIQNNRIYYAEDFGITVIKSGVDFNGNGVDDYTDMMLGARDYLMSCQPTYDGSYHAGGYPPDSMGVCTDVIWQAFRYAGYCLKDMVTKDIDENLFDYPRVAEEPDPNIDFRRVPNLKVFFEKYAESLTLDTTDISQWQPGDIITYDGTHIAMVSDKRNRHGVPYIIHHGGSSKYEENALVNKLEISGHFRFDASKVPDELKIPYI